jgi:hypothetical protein
MRSQVARRSMGSNRQWLSSATLMAACMSTSAGASVGHREMPGVAQIDKHGEHHELESCWVSGLNLPAIERALA